MKRIQNKFFTLLFVILYSAVFIFGYGSYACDSECEMCFVECRCDMTDASMNVDGLKISNYCPQVANDDILSIISSEQINLRIFNGFSNIKVVLNKTILSDLLSDIFFKKNRLNYKPPDYLTQNIILKTSQLLI